MFSLLQVLFFALSVSSPLDNFCFEIFFLKKFLFSRLRKYLRADVCKYQPEVCNSEKFKILKKIHNIAHGKLLQEVHVLLRSDNYF